MAPGRKTRSNRIQGIVARSSFSGFFWFLGAIVLLEPFLVTLGSWGLARLGYGPFALPKSVLETYPFFLAAIGNIQVTDLSSITTVGKVLYGFQALLGFFVGAGAIGYTVSKLNRPNPDTFIFSRQAFYVSDARRFGVLIVNTSSEIASNLKFMSVVRYFRRHSDPGSYCLPYLANSALFFYLDDFDVEAADARLFDPGRDGIKVALSCEVNQLQYSVAVKYLFEDICVVKDTDFMDQALFEEPDLADSQFWKLFHTPTAGAPTLHILMTERRRLAMEKTEPMAAIEAPPSIVTGGKSRSRKAVPR